MLTTAFQATRHTPSTLTKGVYGTSIVLDYSYSGLVYSAPRSGKQVDETTFYHWAANLSQQRHVFELYCLQQSSCTIIVKQRGGLLYRNYFNNVQLTCQLIPKISHAREKCYAKIGTYKQTARTGETEFQIITSKRSLQEMRLCDKEYTFDLSS